MSAAVLPFTGQWHGATEPTPYENRSECRAIHDARLIRAAKQSNDDWTARVLLAMLATLDSKQRDLLEFRLLGANLDSESGAQALAVVHFLKGTNAHRKAVGSHVEAFSAREAE